MRSKRSQSSRSSRHKHTLEIALTHENPATYSTFVHFNIDFDAATGGPGRIALTLDVDAGLFRAVA